MKIYVKVNTILLGCLCELKSTSEFLVMTFKIQCFLGFIKLSLNLGKCLSKVWWRWIWFSQQQQQHHWTVMYWFLITMTNIHSYPELMPHSYLLKKVNILSQFNEIRQPNTIYKATTNEPNKRRTIYIMQIWFSVCRIEKKNP